MGVEKYIADQQPLKQTTKRIQYAHNKGDMKDTIEIRGILLKRDGDHIVAEAWMPDGSYREVIREQAEGPISHCVHAGGIHKSKTLESMRHAR